MREQSICGLQISLSKGRGAFCSGLTDNVTDLSLLTQRFFRREHVVMILLAAFLPIEIACGGNMSSSGGGGTANYYATGKGPTAVATGDFNGDKILDLAVINHTDNTVSVLLGNGDGTFRQHVDYPAGTYVNSIAVADFNGDGKQDVATDYGLLLGNGDGTFLAIMPLPTAIDSASEIKLVNRDSATASTAAAGNVALGDMNGDGKPDLVFVGGIMLSNGDGTFRAGDTLYVGYACCVAIGDINGDGKLDVVQFTSSFHASGWVTGYFGNGDGTLDQLNPTLQEAGELGYGVALSDFNGDGKQDIVAGELDGVDVLLGNGDGNFHFLNNFETKAGAVQAITVADLNADGRPDVVAVNGASENGGQVTKSSNTVSILLGNGDGSFRTHIDYPTGLTPTSVAVGDFNGDGKLDLAVTNKDDNTVSILLGNGDGTFR